MHRQNYASSLVLFLIDGWKGAALRHVEDARATMGTVEHQRAAEDEEELLRMQVAFNGQCLCVYENVFIRLKCGIAFVPGGLQEDRARRVCKPGMMAAGGTSRHTPL